jgi:succinoglycan biosynthesis transport protein ExoP
LPHHYARADFGDFHMSAADRLERAREAEGVTAMLAMLRRRWLIAAGVLVACLVVAVYHQRTTPKVYKATASVAFQSGTLSDSALQVTSTGSSEPQREADTEVLIAHSPEVALGVQKQLHSQLSVEELLNDVQVEAAPSADILDIVASTGDPTQAAQLANAFAEHYIDFRATSEIEGINGVADKLEQQLSALPAGVSPERTTLEQSLQRLSALRAVAGGGANIIGRATVPGEPSGTRLSSTILLGLIAGIALAFTCVLIVEALDRRIKTLEECEAAYKLSALTSIPQSAFHASRPEVRQEALESYRILRSALDFAAVTRRLDTLLITSAIAGEGKTTAAIELSRVIALAGRRVTLIELDLRRPTFHQHFNLDPNGGLTTALTESTPVADLLEEPIAELPELSVLPAGRLPHNPSELLGSPGMVRIISELAQRGDILIIDAPPLNPVADTQVLLNNPAIHATLVVARLNHVKRDQVRRATGILARHQIEPVGLVVTGASDQGLYGYGAYDGYGSVEGASPMDELAADLSQPSAKRQLPH